MVENENQKQKITVGWIASWLLGLFFLLAGVAAFFTPGSAGMGVTGLLIACVLLPPFRAYIYRKTGKSLSTGARVVLFMILAVAGGASMSQGEWADISQINAADSGSAQSVDVEDSEVSNTAKLPPVQKGIWVEEFSLEYGDYGSRKVIGTVRNSTKKEPSYVQVEFNLYDEAGNQVGSTLANINNLEPGGVWKFEAPIFEDRAVQAKLKGITSF